MSLQVNQPQLVAPYRLAFGVAGVGVALSVVAAVALAALSTSQLPLPVATALGVATALILTHTQVAISAATLVGTGTLVVSLLLTLVVVASVYGVQRHRLDTQLLDQEGRVKKRHLARESTSLGSRAASGIVDCLQPVLRRLEKDRVRIRTSVNDDKELEVTFYIQPDSPGRRAKSVTYTVMVGAEGPSPTLRFFQGLDSQFLIPTLGTLSEEAMQKIIWNIQGHLCLSQ